jgi:hypothetical protein
MLALLLMVIFVISFYSKNFVYYSIASPNFFNLLTIAFSALLVTSLYTNDLINSYATIVFTINLLGYLIGVKIVTYKFSGEQFKFSIINIVSKFGKSEIKYILYLNMFLITCLGLLGIAFDGSGDSRQQFARLFLPIQILVTGISQMSLVLLLTDKISNAYKYIYIFFCVILSIPFSGKSVFFPIFFLIGLQSFIGQIQINLKIIVGSISFFTFSFMFIAIQNYGATELEMVIDLFITRLMMSGDVYIYAYQNDFLENVRKYYNPNFIMYLIHPITSLVGLRAYDRPLGAMLGSEASGFEVFTGPNPQTPVFLDFFFPNYLSVQFTLSLIMGIISFIICRIAVNKQYMIRCPKYSNLLILTAAIYLPLLGFIDFSRFIIGLISLLIAKIFIKCFLYFLKGLKSVVSQRFHIRAS